MCEEEEGGEYERDVLNTDVEYNETDTESIPDVASVKIFFSMMHSMMHNVYIIP